MNANSKTKISGVLVAMASLAALPAFAEPATPASGQTVAKTVCARCHDTTSAKVRHRQAGDGSPPPFVLIAQNPKMTHDELRRFLRLPHGQMNNVFLTQADIDAVIAYIESFRER